MVDQNGFARRIGLASDLGAVEFHNIDTNLAVANLADAGPGSLRFAAEYCHPGANTFITFAGGNGGSGSYGSLGGSGGNGGSGFGGGIYNAEVLTLNQSTLSGTSAIGGDDSYGGSRWAGSGNSGYPGLGEGGGIFNSGTLAVNRSP